MIQENYFAKCNTVVPDYLRPTEINASLSRFNKMRAESIYGFRNLLPVENIISSAFKYQQISLNTQLHYNAIIMDIDDEGKTTEWLDVGLPTPTIQTLNKHNNKAHLVWLLKTPVYKEHKHAVDYYFAIVDSLKKILTGADVRYTNTSTKNFLNTELYRVTYNDLSYELGDFKGFILQEYAATKKTKNMERPTDDFLFNFSRHLYMFEKLRFVGYRLSQDKSVDLVEALSDYAEAINELYEQPINFKSIVKSISNFCYDNRNNFSRKIVNQGIMKFKKVRYTNKEEFLKIKKERQSLSAARTTSIKKIKTAKAIKKATLKLTRLKIPQTIGNISKAANLSTSTIRRNTQLITFFCQNKKIFIRYIRVIVVELESKALLLPNSYTDINNAGYEKFQNGSFINSA